MHIPDLKDHLSIDLEEKCFVPGHYYLIAALAKAVLGFDKFLSEVPTECYIAAEDLTPHRSALAEIGYKVDIRRPLYSAQSAQRAEILPIVCRCVVM